MRATLSAWQPEWPSILPLPSQQSLFTSASRPRLLIVDSVDMRGEKEFQLMQLLRLEYWLRHGGAEKKTRPACHALLHSVAAHAHDEAGRCSRDRFQRPRVQLARGRSELTGHTQPACLAQARHCTRSASSRTRTCAAATAPLQATPLSPPSSQTLQPHHSTPPLPLSSSSSSSSSR